MSIDMAPPDLPEVLAANVRRELDARGWSQSELARRCGWKPPQITEILKGNLNYRLATVQRLAEIFGVSPASLLIAPPEESSESEPSVEKVS
jgi:transcriptional regulator with XRE-family HTH domain